MISYNVKILKTEFVTHDVKRFRVEKPAGYKYLPGQATEVTIKGMEEKAGKGPFTFTSLNEKEYLEFTIKIYQTGKLTKELGKLKAGDALIIHDVWGTITYQGPGVFFAGGAGVTPFIAIFRQLYKEGKIGDNKLILSNKTDEDIILKDEFEKMLGKNFINFLTREKSDKYYNQKIDKDLIKKLVSNFSQHFYICGPDKFVEDIHNILNDLKVPEDLIVVEK
jgi:ferredoxin-NADP reductase